MGQRLLRSMLFTTAVATMALAGCQTLSVPPGSGTATPTVAKTATGTPGTATPTPSGTSSTAFASFIIAATTGRGNPLSIKNVNPISGKTLEFAGANPSDQGIVDAVSPNGQLLAYHLDDGSGTANYAIAAIDGSAKQPVGQLKAVLGSAVWLADNKRLAVGTENGITLLDTTSGAKTKVSTIQAFLVAASADGKAFYGTGTGANSPQGALMRIPADGSAFVQLTPRVTGGKFVFTADGKFLYYQNTGPSGTPGIYKVDTATGSAAKIRDNSDLPVGFTANGDLLTIHVTQPAGTLALIQLGATSTTADKILVAKLLPDGTTAPDTIASDIAVAPDGSGIIIRGSPANLSFRFYFEDLVVAGAQPKLAIALDNASRADLIGWDTVLLPAQS